MSDEKVRIYSENVTTEPAPEPAVGRSKAVAKGNRTRALNAKLKPLDDLDAVVESIHRRVEQRKLDRNDARVMIQALSLRKDVQLAKLKVVEVVRRIDEFDVRAELEELKNELRERGKIS